MLVRLRKSHGAIVYNPDAVGVDVPGQGARATTIDVMLHDAAPR